jgi:glycosyltransferase involved in cell wall biosynthesis
LRVLLTNITLGSRSGTETYVRDLAVGLLERGHLPVVYSPEAGAMAEEIRAATVPVVDDLADTTVVPDVIHGHHGPETLTALLHFGGVPAVFVCHDWSAWHDVPPRFPRILRYVAVDDTCRDKLVVENRIPASRVEVLLNSVDLRRFRPRGPLPERPKRALVFSHRATEELVAPLREACGRSGVELDVIGDGSGNPTREPERVLGEYDLVFARGRSALEAMAVGAAVIVCDAGRLGGLVTVDRFERLRRLNFGIRALREAAEPAALLEEIARYDPADAAAVSRSVRETAGLEHAVDAHLALYEAVVAEHRARPAGDPVEEGRAAAAYVRWWGPRWRERDRLAAEAAALGAERDHLRAESEAQRAELARLESEWRRRGDEIRRIEGEWSRRGDAIAELEDECARLRAELAPTLAARRP